MDEMPHSTAPLDGGEIGHVMRKKNTPCMPEAKAVLARTFVDFSLNIELEIIGIVYSENKTLTHSSRLTIYVDITIIPRLNI